ncbi:MAG: transcription antitermination factor NusB [Polyangiales bacterium]
MTDAREVATRVLVRVSKEGAFASMALDAELARSGLDARDAAFATNLVYGALRSADELDAVIRPHLHKGKKLDPLVESALRIAAHQLLHLDRVPAHAAVDSAVKLVRKERGPKVAGFVNAVLRKVASKATTSAVVTPKGLPDWLTAVLRDSLGEARAAAYLAAAGSVPPIDLRVLPSRIARDALAEKLRAAVPRARIEPCAHSPLGIRTRGLGDPRRAPGFAEGEFVVQEEGSQLIALLVGAEPGERVLDACAGRGGKTTFLGSAVGPRGSVVALDVHEGRLRQIPPLFASLGLEASLETIPVDLTVGTGGLEPGFDRVLVDAPCTGLGTLVRRPEILARVGPEDAERMAAIQLAILERAATLVKPGGVLVYSVCSPTRAEGADVVARFHVPGFVPRPFGAEAERLGLSPDADGILRLGPFLAGSEGGTDGYQIFRWECVDRSRIGS